MAEHGTTLSHRKIYILPTKQGYAFVLLLLFMLFGSINYNNNLAYLLTFMLVSLSLLSIIYVYRNLYALEITGGKCAPVFAGEQARFVLTLYNPKPLDRFEVMFTPKQRPVSNIIHIQGFQTLTMTLPVQTHQRGHLTLPALKITSSYPLGLFGAWTWISLDIDCLVYPRPSTEAPPLPTHQAEGKGMATQPGCDDFLGFRKATPSDPPRHLDWKSFAKGQPLMAKQFGQQLNPHLWFDWSQMDDVNPEDKLAKITYWVLEAERQQVSYGLQLPQMKIIHLGY